MRRNLAVLGPAFDRACLGGAYCLALGLSSSNAHAAPWLELETGVVFAGSNEVRVPGDSGTRFSLVGDLDTDPGVYGRARVGWDFGRHRVAVLVAPVSTSSEGRIDRSIRFSGRTFEPDSVLEAKYQFDTYRASYRYLLVDRQDVTFGAGATVLVRDAAIRVSSSDGSFAEKTNVGVVPLLKVDATWRLTPILGLALDAEGFAVPQGRAFDVLAAVQFRAWDRWSTYVGYRFIEGGADNDEVYNFAWLHFTALGVHAAY